MWPLIRDWVEKLLFDKVYAESAIRGVLFLLAGAIHTGIINLGVLGWWGGLLGMAAAVVISAGNRNPSTDEILRLVREEMARKS